MKSANIPSGATRTSEVGLYWVEVITGATGSIEVQPQSCVRVRSGGTGTVVIDGVLSMTMSSGEIALLNVGNGNPTDSKRTVTLTVNGSSWVQIGQEIDRPFPDNN